MKILPGTVSLGLGLIVLFCVSTSLGQAGSTSAVTNYSHRTAFVSGMPKSRFETSGYKDPFFPKRELVESPKATSELLRLEGISLGARKRLAVINGRTFEVGEEGEIKSGTARVRIHCFEINENSAVVEFPETGQRQTLKLKRRLHNP